MSVNQDPETKADRSLGHGTDDSPKSSYHTINTSDTPSVILTKGIRIIG